MSVKMTKNALSRSIVKNTTAKNKNSLQMWVRGRKYFNRVIKHGHNWDIFHLRLSRRDCGLLSCDAGKSCNCYLPFRTYRPYLVDGGDKFLQNVSNHDVNTQKTKINQVFTSSPYAWRERPLESKEQLFAITSSIYLCRRRLWLTEKEKNSQTERKYVYQSI
jgi:hypothetical protein